MIGIWGLAVSNVSVALVVYGFQVKLTYQNSV